MATGPSRTFQADKAHHGEDGRFHNPWQSYVEFGFKDFAFKVAPQTKRFPVYPLPTIVPDWQAIHYPQEPLQTMWVGHATFLIQSCGYNMITDPVFSARASPTQWMGPARYTLPACSIADLPPLHMVLLSHNHYDHIDTSSIYAILEAEERYLREPYTPPRSADGRQQTTAYTTRPYTGTIFVVPLGVRPLVESLGVAPHKIVELDWWDTFTPAPLQITGTPASPSSPSSVSSPSSPSVAPSTSLTSDARCTLVASAERGYVDRSGSASVHSHPYLLTTQSRSSTSSSTGGGSGSSAATASSSDVTRVDAAMLPAGHIWDVPMISAVPAQHQSARTLWDRNKTLWVGYVVTMPVVNATSSNASSTSSAGVSTAGAGVASSSAATPATSSSSTTTTTGHDDTRLMRFYFTGDTGYRNVPEGIIPYSTQEQALPVCPAFREIGERYGPLDLAALPIGAYSPRWFMSSFHAAPEDSVELHRDVRSRRSIGMHWGTFPLTDEQIEEPPVRLAAALQYRNIDADEFVAVRGGTVITAERGILDETGRVVVRHADVETMLSTYAPPSTVGAGSSTPTEATTATATASGASSPSTESPTLSAAQAHEHDAEAHVPKKSWTLAAAVGAATAPHSPKHH